MNLKRSLLVVLACLLVGVAAEAAEKTKKVYVYGIAISFNDSTVYLTDIQKLDSAVVTSKTKFLYGRDNYSYQLRDYLKGKGFNNPTCETTFALKQKDIEKKFIATKKRYGNGKFTLKHITPSEFQYTVISIDQEEESTVTKEERKAMKQKVKEEKKKAKEAKSKGPKPDGQKPDGPRPNGPMPNGPMPR